MSLSPLEYYSNIIMENDTKLTEQTDKDLMMIHKIFIDKWFNKQSEVNNRITEFSSDLKLVFLAMDKVYNDEDEINELNKEMENETNENDLKELEEFHKFRHNIKLLTNITEDNITTTKQDPLIFRTNFDVEIISTLFSNLSALDLIKLITFSSYMELCKC